jgi:ceramide glucosyltransferase
VPAPLTLLQLLLLAVAACGGVYHLLAAWCARSYLRDQAARESAALEASGGEQPPISILKPLRGADAEAYDCFATFCRQEYPAYELIFGVMDEDDPSIPIVRRLQTSFPEVPIRLVVSGGRIGANLKVSNLANMLEAARHDLLLIGDSDMRVTPDYLARIAAGFAGGVGLVTCPYRGVNLQSAAAALEALGIAAGFLPGVLLVARLGRPDFAFGSTIALRRSLLEQIGGLEGIADYLADDFQLGHRTVAAGRSVRLSACVVESVLANRGLRAMLARRLRWARTVRACRPAGHAASIITQTSVFALAYLAATGFTEPGWLLLGAALLVRTLTAWDIAVHSLGARELGRWFWLLPLEDLLAFALWVGSWLGRHVLWRGVRFRLRRGGRMERVG